MLTCTEAGPDPGEGAGVGAPPVAPEPKEEQLVGIFQILVCPRNLQPTSGSGESRPIQRRSKAPQLLPTPTSAVLITIGMRGREACGTSARIMTIQKETGKNRHIRGHGGLANMLVRGRQNERMELTAQGSEATCGFGGKEAGGGQSVAEEPGQGLTVVAVTTSDMHQDIPNHILGNTDGKMENKIISSVSPGW